MKDDASMEFTPFTEEDLSESKDVLGLEKENAFQLFTNEDLEESKSVLFGFVPFSGEDLSESQRVLVSEDENFQLFTDEDLDESMTVLGVAGNSGKEKEEETEGQADQNNRLALRWFENLEPDDQNWYMTDAFNSWKNGVEPEGWMKEKLKKYHIWESEEVPVEVEEVTSEDEEKAEKNVAEWLKNVQWEGFLRGTAAVAAGAGVGEILNLGPGMEGYLAVLGLGWNSVLNLINKWFKNRYGVNVLKVGRNYAEEIKNKREKHSNFAKRAELWAAEYSVRGLNKVFEVTGSAEFRLMMIGWLGHSLFEVAAGREHMFNLDAKEAKTEGTMSVSTNTPEPVETSVSEPTPTAEPRSSSSESGGGITAGRYSTHEKLENLYSAPEPPEVGGGGAVNRDAVHEKLENLYSAPEPPESVREADKVVGDMYGRDVIPGELKGSALADKISLENLRVEEMLNTSHWTLAEQWVNQLSDVFKLNGIELSEAAKLYLTDAVHDVNNNQGPVNMLKDVFFNKSQIATYLNQALERLGAAETTGFLSDADITALKDVAEFLLKK